MALWAEMCAAGVVDDAVVVVVAAGSVLEEEEAECSWSSIEELVREWSTREATEVWEARMASQYQHVCSRESGLIYIRYGLEGQKRNILTQRLYGSLKSL